MLSQQTRGNKQKATVAKSQKKRKRTNEEMLIRSRHMVEEAGDGVEWSAGIENLAIRKEKKMKSGRV